ncbi:MAG TPA: isoprenylcysteine carboxylmethyltransferase family protein [Pseudolysinimonas sp.]|jgi:protein-S-isoprenylcysteine O-methyltransferase Ste14
MQPLPFESPPAGVIFDVVMFVFVAGELVIRLSTIRNRARGTIEWGSLVVVVAGLAVGIVGGILIASRWGWAAIPVGRVAFFVIGIAFMALGIAVRAWSVIVLGRNFTVYVQVRDERPVVDTGPYRLLRHPSYTGLLLVCLGIGLALGNWLALIVIVVVPTAVILVRIRVEERALLAGIGEPYRRFMATRKRLIPYLW